jgi:hypothetical protein
MRSARQRIRAIDVVAAVRRRRRVDRLRHARQRLMANQMPRLAQRAERQVARVLFVAGRAELGGGDAEIRAAAASVGRDGSDGARRACRCRRARRSASAMPARAEYARRGGTPEALALQARAFGADPLDVETAGNLAFLLLAPAAGASRSGAPAGAARAHPARCTLPRRKIEDWATFAIASALAGRERDARNAFLVTLSLAPNLERHARRRSTSNAIYGERLRAPIEAMLQSANASGRAKRIGALRVAASLGGRRALIRAHSSVARTAARANASARQHPPEQAPVAHGRQPLDPGDDHRVGADQDARAATLDGAGR